MSIVVDTNQWPVVQTVWDGEQTLADVERYEKEVHAMYARRQPFVTITFMKKYKTTPEIRRRIAEMMASTESDVKQYSVASAMIAPNTAFRFILSTVFLIKRMPAAYSVCANFDEALSFCRQEAMKKGLRLPPTVVPLLKL